MCSWGEEYSDLRKKPQVRGGCGWIWELKLLCVPLGHSLYWIHCRLGGCVLPEFLPFLSVTRHRYDVMSDTRIGCLATRKK